jgi:predicted metal-dependent enzyme (double-stranded beta helix superfamily)
MTLTSTTTLTANSWLSDMADPVRRAASRFSDPAQTASAVADALRGQLPSLDILTPEQLLGAPEGYQQHVLHVEPGGAFSITALVWRPGQMTPIHDHVCWCTVGVLSGVEHEILYERRLRHGRRRLIEVGRRNAFPGDVGGFAPPGDIHRVQNTGSDIAVSLHVYGADIGARGTSVRRTYDRSPGTRH